MALRHAHLTVFMHFMNRIIDAGEHSDITPEHIQRRVEDGDLMAWLRTRFAGGVSFAGGIDLSLLTVDGRDTELTEEFRRIDAVHGPIDFGVRRSGICLLMAWSVEVLQQIEEQNRAQRERGR